MDWRELLRRFWSETTPADYSWMRPNRRHLWTGLYLPGVVREGVGEVAIAVDCSGSVSARQLRLFEAEVRSILEGQRPERVYVLYFDAVVHKVETYEAGQRIDLNPVGGGGTEFGPCFEWLEDQGHPASDPGLSDRSLRIIPTIGSRISRPVGFDRKPEGTVRRGHSHAGCLAPNGSMGCGASAQANEDLNLTPIIRWSPQIIREGGSLCIRHIAFSRTAPRSETRDRVDGARS